LSPAIQVTNVPSVRDATLQLLQWLDKAKTKDCTKSRHDETPEKDKPLKVIMTKLHSSVKEV
jgi:hypothetical protein